MTLAKLCVKSNFNFQDADSGKYSLNHGNVLEGKDSLRIHFYWDFFCGWV